MKSINEIKELLKKEFRATDFEKFIEDYVEEVENDFDEEDNLYELEEDVIADFRLYCKYANMGEFKNEDYN